MIEAPSTLPTSDARLPRGQALRRGLGANPLLLVGGLLYGQRAARELGFRERLS